MLAIFSVILSMVSVQVGASLAKGLFHVIGPMPTVMFRISIAAILLVLIWRPWRKAMSKKAAQSIFLYGVCLGLMNMTFYLSLTKIPLGICVALEFTGPLVVALLSSKQKTDFIWALLAALGVVLILPLRSEQTALDHVGILLALFAGMCWAFYIVFGKRVGTLVHGGVASSVGMAVAAFVSVPFGLADLRWSALTGPVLTMAVGVAVLSSAIPYTIEMFAMKKIPTKTFSILMSLEPAVAAIFGYIILREHLDHSQLFAIICVMIACAGSATTSKVQPVLPETT